MDSGGEKGLPKETVTAFDDDAYIVRSPAADKVKNLKIPEIPLHELLFQGIDMNYDLIKDKVWVGDAIKGTSYKFSEIKPLSRKIASALTRLGFKKGDVLYFVTYDVALIYIIYIGAWLCGGSVRGSFQKEQKDVCSRQMKEVKSRFILCDPETSNLVQSAAKELDWSVKILAIGGEVPEAIAFEDMIENEDCACVPENLKINPKEDVLVIVNTSGSTGTCKGVMQTHFARVAYFTSIGLPKKQDSVSDSSMVATLNNFMTGGYSIAMTCLLNGVSFYSLYKFSQEALMESIQKYKPNSVFIYPYAIHGFVQSPEIEKCDLSFLKKVATGGAVINYSTAKALEEKLPHVKLVQRYGMSESQTTTLSDYGESFTLKNSESEGKVAGLKFKKINGGTHLTSGHLLPNEEAKILDPVSGLPVGRNIPGNLFIKTLFFMKGYLSSGENQMEDVLDENGWFNTGDVAFFDEDDLLYIVDRSKFTFKYYMHWVSPAEVEAMILKHPDVLSVAVIGVPDPRTTSAAKAFVVRKPGTHVSEEEIKLHVAERTDEIRHLHGGVAFVDSFPLTSGWKVDRTALLKLALAESTLA